MPPNGKLELTDDDWVVLWIDGYSSHLTLHTSRLCEMNKIVLYCFKAHSSYICQPNDVGSFKPLKTEWKNAVTRWRLDNSYESLTRAALANVLALAVDNLNPESIIAGYRATGLYPFNPDAVHYKRLTEISRRKYNTIKFRNFEAKALVEN